MESKLVDLTFHCWNHYFKPLIVAVVSGFLAGAVLGDLAHAGPLAETTAPSQPVASAGRIRQQAQRIAKLYQQIGLKLDADRALRLIAQARRQMDGDLAGLARSTTADRDRQILDRIRKTWEEMRRDSDSPFSPQTRDRLFIHADDLSTLAGRLSLHFELGAAAPAARLLDLSLRQGMLVQRLARLYLVAWGGDNSTGLHVDIEQARREFSSALGELADARENSDASRRALDLARVQWIFFEQSVLSIKDRQNSVPMNVATSSERILEVLEELSTHYARVGEPGSPEAKGRAS